MVSQIYWCRGVEALESSATGGCMSDYLEDGSVCKATSAACTANHRRAHHHRRARATSSSSCARADPPTTSTGKCSRDTTGTTTGYLRREADNSHFNYAHHWRAVLLVVTPMTDRCYMTPTGAMHLLGGAQRPAGTGKTESTRTRKLGRSAGVQLRYNLDYVYGEILRRSRSVRCLGVLR